jgi:hypothetical protein
MLLQVWQVLLYGGFAESVGVKARVALLQAHAQCANLAQAFGRCSSGSGSGTSKDPAAAADGDALVFSRPGCFSPNSTINNELCCSIVVKSQAPHLDMLLLLWWGALLDYAAFNSTLPGVLQNHKSLLFGHTYPEVVEAVQGTYAAAWPSVLIAVASNLPGPQQLIASTANSASSSSTHAAVSAQQQDTRQAAWSAFVDLISSGTELVAKGGSSSKGVSGLGASAGAAAADKAAQLWHQQLLLQCRGMHAVLLEVCLMMLSEAAAACAAALLASQQEQQQQQVALPAAAVAAARRVAVSLQAMHLLLTRQHIQAGLSRVDVCADVSRALAAVADQALLPWLQLAHQQQQQQQQDQSLTMSMKTFQVPTSSSAAAAAANSQCQPDCASIARDKVFSAVLLASCELVQGIAAATCCQPGTSQPQPAAAAAAALDGEVAAALRAQVLETVLALSSIAVPFLEPDGSCSAAAEQVSYMPAFTEPVQQQQQQSRISREAYEVSSQTLQPSPQAAAACSSLCRTAAWLTQHQQQQTDLQVTEAVWLLALRLVITAAPGQQLQAAQQLMEACLQGCAASIQQQQSAHTAAVSACNTLCEAVMAAAQQLCSSSNAKPVLLDAAARLPVLLTGLLQAAACCGSCPDVPACTAAVDRCCGVLVWVLKQYQPYQHQQQQLLLGSGIGPAAAAESGMVAVRVLEALRLLLQDSVSATGQQQQGRAALARQCAAALTPQVGADGMTAHRELLACAGTTTLPSVLDCHQQGQ